MGLRRVPYRSLAALLARELVVGEEPATAALVAELRHVKRSGRFTRAEFLAMCRWKSPRAIRHCRRNSAAAIRRVSRPVFATRSERRRMELLTGLPRVSEPRPSAILTLVAPRRHRGLALRAWHLLF